MVGNPFTPGFGTSPPVVVGREQLLAAFQALFDTGAGREWATFLEAHRGAGKTVLLDAIQDVAAEAGWLIVQEDAGTTQTRLVPRITDSILALSEQHTGRTRRRRRSFTTGVGAFGVTASHTVDYTPEAPTAATLRSAIETLTGSTGNGLLITVDEIHRSTVAERADIGNAVQHARRNGRPIAIVVAGLHMPHETHDPTAVTFLGRCHRPEIAMVPDHEIARGLTETANLGGATFDDRALLHAVQACEGSAYMMQLVGYHAYRAARQRITLGHVSTAIGQAQKEVRRSVLEPVIDRLPEMQIAFLQAMARSARPVKIAAIRQLLDKSSNEVNQYRRRLLAAGVIQQIDRGYIDFAMPGMAEALDDADT